MSVAGGGAVARMGAAGGGAAAKPTPKLLRGEEAVKLAEREIHNYLRRFKRPHSLLQLWENTCKKKGVSRASVQSALARLVESAVVSTKLYGKFAIYYLNPEQCASGAPTPDEVVEINFSAHPAVLAELNTATTELRRTERRVAFLVAQPTNAELDRQLDVASLADTQRAAGDDETLAARVSVLSAHTLVTPEELASAKAEYKANLGRWVTMRRIFACAPFLRLHRFRIPLTGQPPLSKTAQVSRRTSSRRSKSLPVVASISRTSPGSSATPRQARVPRLR